MYPILDLPVASRLDTEQLGSKPKFWVQLDNDKWLFKEARFKTGEDWAEKAGAEIARAVGISAADVELAAFEEKRGSISRNFISVARGEALVHGNEILRFGSPDTIKIRGFANKTIRWRTLNELFVNSSLTPPPKFLRNSRVT
ncbi:MAG: hypothetical protein IPK20_06660 [Betaproteobacteria bacterium]|nr:hypothetical protein [Betaproteobacteria bacterium]